MDFKKEKKSPTITDFLTLVSLLMLVSMSFVQFTAVTSMPGRKPGMEKQHNKYMLKK